MGMSRSRCGALALLLAGVLTLGGCSGEKRLHLPPARERAPGYGPDLRAGRADAEWLAIPARGRLFHPGETVRLHLAVTRYFGPLPAGSRARLTLRLWHADPVGVPLGPSGQAHRLRLNGHDLPEAVGGVAGAWSIYSTEVPGAWLHLPAAPEPGGRPGPALNEVELAVQGAGGDGSGGVLVDWARLELDGPRPWVLAHGFLANQSSWKYWEPWAAAAGVPTWSFNFASNHGSMWDHATELRQQVAAARKHFGVDTVNLVASSKGAVDGRAYLARQDPDVERAAWLAGPHGGSELADIAKMAEGLPGGRLVSRLGEPALTGSRHVPL